MAKNKAPAKAAKAAPIDPSIIATRAVEKAKKATPEGFGVRGPKGVAMTAVVTLLAGTNPKRAASKAYERFALYQDGMSVEAFLAAGGTTPDLVYDAAHGFIDIEGYDPKMVVKKEKPAKEAKAPRAKKAKSAEAVAAESELAAATVEETID